jgi:hypothetical protein
VARRHLRRAELRHQSRKERVRDVILPYWISGLPLEPHLWLSAKNSGIGG